MTSTSVSNVTKNNFWQNVKNYFTEYSSRSGIHGVAYLGEQNRSIFEKFWWLTALGFALYFCFSFTITAYQKWENSPVIVSFATKETPIWQIPFPAVTICPETKSRPTFFNYTKYLTKKVNNETLSQNEELEFAYIAMLCNIDSKLISQSAEEFDDELFDFFEKAGPTFYENIFDCYFMGRPYNCSNIFTSVITDEGLCYSFNLLNREDMFTDKVKHYKHFHYVYNATLEWSLEEGYSFSADKETYPRRASLAGATFDFELKLRSFDQDFEFNCGNSIQGYKIQIHNPASMPRVKQQHFRIPLNQVIIAAMMPSMITTSNEIKQYLPNRRQCFFPSERSLKYFRIYTQQNCQIECKTNYTLEMCGCVDFYMPRTENETLCGGSKKICMQHAEDKLLSQRLEENIRKAKGLRLHQDGYHDIVLKCNCMPECTSMSYVIENSQSEWDWHRKYDNDYHNASISKTHMSYLQVFFKGNDFITSERHELYGVTDFLANAGGLLGLFTGFSMLSLIEILYYLTLRLFCNIRLFGKTQWSTQN